jgi:hypothetical protein
MRARAIVNAVGRALSGRRVDLRFLDDLPVAVRGRIVYEGVRVFERDAVVRLRQEVKARLEYHDFLAFERGGPRWVCRGRAPGLSGLGLAERVGGAGAFSPAEPPCKVEVYKAWSKVMQAAEEHPAEPVPLHIRNDPTPLMKGLGYGKGYRYDHAEPEALAGKPAD